MKAALDKEGDYCYLVGRRYPVHKVKTDLASRSKHDKTSDETTFNLNKILDARARSFDDSRLARTKSDHPGVCTRVNERIGF